MARRRHAVAVQRSTRIPTWLSAGLTTTAAGGGGSTLLSSLNAAALALRPFTIIRTRLFVHIQSDQIVGTELAQGVFAAIVVEEEAVDAGIGSLPTPITEATASFLVYEGFVNSFLFLS